MSVTLNEAALKFLLESEAGPVGRMLERTANVVAGNYEAVEAIILQNPDFRPKVDYVLETSEDGLRAVVGMVSEGRISFYLAEKFQRESDWIVGAVMTAWDSQI